MDRAEKDGKRRISGATKILDEAAEKGHVFDAKIIRSSAKESRAGQPPLTQRSPSFFGPMQHEVKADAATILQCNQLMQFLN